MGKISEKRVAKKKTGKKIPRLTRPLQISTGNPQLKEIEDVTPIVEFLESFRQLIDPRAQLPSRLISIKVPEPLLAAFKFKACEAGVPYQTMIKRLMMEWLQRNQP